MRKTAGKMADDRAARGPTLGEGLREGLPAGDYYAVPFGMADDEKRQTPNSQERDVSKVRAGYQLVITWFKR